MQVDLTTSELLLLRSGLAARRRTLERRKPDPARLGALSTLTIERAHVQDLDDKLAAAMKNGEGA